MVLARSLRILLIEIFPVATGALLICLMTGHTEANPPGKLVLKQPQDVRCLPTPKPTPKPTPTPLPGAGAPQPAPATPPIAPPAPVTPKPTSGFIQTPQLITPKPSPTPTPTPAQPTTPTCPSESDPSPGAPGGTPVVNPCPAPSPTPPVKPTPKPLLPIPKPPANLPVEEPDPPVSGIPLIDDALAGKTPKTVLPTWYNYPWRKLSHPHTWTVYAAVTMKTHGKDLIASNPDDIQWFCPKYSSLTEDQRLIFWIRFISVLSEIESTFGPISVMRDVAVGPNVFSTGLLQLSLSSARNPRWGCDMIQTQDDLFYWRKNMTCGIRIMNALMKEDHAVTHQSKAKNKRSWFGLARYWGPLRDLRIKSDERRFCIDEVVRLRREDWLAEGNTNRHANKRDSEFKSAGEKDFEKVLRIVNQFPFCN